MIGIHYDDEYAVEEVFQLLKVPWEWYTPSSVYDVVISKNNHIPDARNVIDLTENDILKKIADTLQRGASSITVNQSAKSTWMRCASRSSVFLR